MFKNILFYVLFFFLLIVNIKTFGQIRDFQREKKKQGLPPPERSNVMDTLAERFISNEKPTLDLNPNKKPDKKKKKKRFKKRIFYDTKTRKVSIRKQKGSGIIHEEFRILKKFKAPSPFLPTKFYYDIKKKEIIETSKDYKEGEGFMPLHGEYSKRENGEITEQGMYYFGGKHGRWESYRYPKTMLVDKDQKNYYENLMLLTDKKYFYKGFPKDAQITYYDREKTRIKEVIPIQHGWLEGYYVAFYESGNIKEKGKYIDGEKVGIWYEYYDKPSGSNRKRETQHCKRAFENCEIVVLREWDEKGKKIVDSNGTKK
jgi:antitoxin component YwqK of YwqJK toxin-antitoxin module